MRLPFSCKPAPLSDLVFYKFDEAVKDKVTGYLVKEHDIDGMANYMIELLTNDELAIAMSKAARKHIEENYSLEKQILSLKNILINGKN